MSARTRSLHLASVGLVAAALLLAGPAFANARFFIINGNDPGVGFNDTTPAAPVGGNPGTTIGEQRLLVFQEAARIWGQTLDSNVLITVYADFEPLPCDATGSTLGSAGPLNAFASVGGTVRNVVAEELDAGVRAHAFPLEDTYYAVALANRFTGQDLEPDSVTDPFTSDIRARFNSDYDDPAKCPVSAQWYYGFDHQHGAKTDLLIVLLHEIGHGLGFTYFEDRTTFEYLDGETPSVYARHLFDGESQKHWTDLDEGSTDAVGTRFHSARNGQLAWDGAAVTAEVPGTLAGRPVFRVTSANQDTNPSIVKDYAVGQAAFGKPLDATGFSGSLQLANPINGCTALTGDYTGKVVVMDRGTCTFVVKAAAAQAAGALAAVIVNNAAGGPPGLGGSDPSVTITTVSLSQSDGTTIKNAVSGGSAVDVTVKLDQSIGLAGADQAGRALMYAPSVFAGGSSVAHWDVSATPNLLMEPAVNPDLSGLDLTVPLFRDIGWFAVDLGISAAGPSSASAGTSVSYAVTVTNPGPSTADAVKIETAAPADLTFVSNGGACTTAFPCQLASMQPGESRTILATYRVSGAPAAATLQTTFTVSGPENYNSTNDTAAVSTALSSGADLSLLAFAGAASPESNTTVVINVSNPGPGDATGVSLAVTANGVTFVSATGGCSQFPCQLGTVAGGTSKQINATYKTPKNKGSYTVTASVTSTSTDPTPANNSASATIQVNESSGCNSSGGFPLPALALLGLTLLLRGRRSPA